jgi:hypothetical protein
VSKAKEDFPEPDKPVITMNLLRGFYTSMFLRLLTLAPLMIIFGSNAIPNSDKPQKYKKYSDRSMIPCQKFCIFTVNFQFHYSRIIAIKESVRN